MTDDLHDDCFDDDDEPTGVLAESPVCGKCGRPTVGEECEACGLPLCPMCFECGCGYCAKCTKCHDDDSNTTISGGNMKATAIRRQGDTKIAFYEVPAPLWRAMLGVVRAVEATHDQNYVYGQGSRPHNIIVKALDKLDAVRKQK
jgi:hypothetical protein